MEEKVEQLKQLLAQAHTVINRRKAELAEKNERIAQLEGIVQKYLNEERQIDCERVLAKVKVEEIEWLCIKSSQGVEWVRQSEFERQLGSQPHSSIQQLDYSRSKDDILVVVGQYEQRMKVLQSELQAQESKMGELKKGWQEAQTECERLRGELQSSAGELVQQSENVRESCLLYGEEQLKQESETRIKLQLLQLQKFSNPILQTLKGHVMMLNQTIFELIQSQHEQRQIMKEQEREAERKLQEVEEERKMEREQRQQHFESGRQQIKQLEHLVEQQQREIKEKNLKIDFMQQESKRNANIQYIKNVIIRFFTEDQSVKQKTIPVIATILQFSESELQLVQQAWDRDQTTLLGKIFRK